MRVKIQSIRNHRITEHTVEVGDQPQQVNVLIENKGGGFTYVGSHPVSSKDVGV